MAFVTGFLAPSSGTAKDPVQAKALFDQEFNPETYFPFGWGSDLFGRAAVNEYILTVKVSAREEYLPSYAMAIAYICDKVISETETKCDYVARILRVTNTAEGEYGNAAELASKIQTAKGDEGRKRAFETSEVEWLEARLWSCEGAIKVFDDLANVADWRPQSHYTRLEQESRKVILSPAHMWIKMRGQYKTSTLVAWRNDNGAPAAINQLVGVLDKCWQPATVPPPWEG